MFEPGSVPPQQRLRAAHLTGVRRIAQAQIPLYGLPPSWHGVRETGSTCFETGVTRDADGAHAEIHETVELVHSSGASTLRIESSDVARSIADHDLLELLAGPGTCRSLTVTVDGRPVAFACAQGADRFVARWIGYLATITITGDRWPIGTGLEIVGVSDTGPYHDGRLSRLCAASGYDLRS